MPSHVWSTHLQQIFVISNDLLVERGSMLDGMTYTIHTLNICHTLYHYKSTHQHIIHRLEL